MENMQKGRWISGLLLVLLASIAELRGEDVQWQAVSDAARTESAPAVTLSAPVPLPDSPPGYRERIAATPQAAPSGILPARFETSAPLAGGTGVSPVGGTGVSPVDPRRSPPEIIAVSAPVTTPQSQPAQQANEQTDGVFAVDRSFSTTAVSPFLPVNGWRRWENNSIARTSANAVVPPVAPGTQMPMIPGWEAPVDTSWGAGLPAGQLPEDPFAQAIPLVNPLRPRLYASAEYLLWWIKGQSVPVLATTSSPSDFGVLGAPTTQVLFGGNQINGNSPFSGARFAVGYWFGCDQNKALEFTGFFLGPRAAGFSTNSATNPVIGRPFVEANNGTETAQLTSLPGVSAGALTISAPTSLWGLGANLRCLLCCGCNYRVTALAGFRNINLNESLTITENVVGLPTAPEPFTNQLITVQDRFATQNHFYGGNVGADARWYLGRWSVDVRGQVALGETVQYLDIAGGQHFVPGIPVGGMLVQNFTGGLLALPSNIGHFHHNVFSVVPEIGVNLGYQILPNLRGFVGYDLLYWSNVIRPGTSIDRVLDVTQIPNFPLHPEPSPVPGLHPAPTFHQQGFWAQGITFGLQFVY
jgi:putative beta barrel porin BBP7